MPFSRIYNTIPNGKVRNVVPSGRTSNFQTGHAGEAAVSVTAGTPIGLLLALTYAVNQVLTQNSYGPRPNVRIVNL